MDERARRATFARLVDREAPSALGIARRLLRDAGEAEDLVQEAFLRTWRDLMKPEPPRAIRPWFYRTLINAGRDRLRRRKVREREVPTPERGEADPATALARRDLVGRVEAAVETLPMRQRECLLLRTRAGLAYRDIAELLGITEGSVKGHLVHARKTLMQRFGAEARLGRGTA